MPPLPVPFPRETIDFLRQLKDKLLSVFTRESIGKDWNAAYEESITVERMAELTRLPEIKQLYAQDASGTACLFERQSADGQSAVKITFKNTKDDLDANPNMFTRTPKGVGLDLYCVFDGLFHYKVLGLTFQEEFPGTLKLYSAQLDEESGDYKFLLIGDKRRESCVYDHSEMKTLSDYLRIFADRDDWMKTVQADYKHASPSLTKS